jgi:hypothetical protein
MSSQGHNSPGTMATSGSGENWINLDYAKSSDGQKTNGSMAITDTTRYLVAYNFGFTIPIGATIDGIVVQIEKYCTISNANNYIVDNEVKIVKSDGSFGTTNNADVSTKWPTTDTYVTHGGNTNLWGETWSASDINNSNFGVAIKAKQFWDFKDTNPLPYIDHIRITVYYTEGGGGGSAIKSVNGLAKADIKSVNGLAIASVKSINGLE